MRDYVDPAWSAALNSQGLDSFAALWALQAAWFEPPNQRRGGWSGVMRIELDGPDGMPHGLFLKRQENHTRRTLRHPISGEPTFAAEMRNLLALRQAQVPTLEPVYYAQRKVDGKWRAMLVTRELVGFTPLHEWVQRWQESGWYTTRGLRQRVIDHGAPLLRRMHRTGHVHNALHPKHVFLAIDDAGMVQMRLIDLEKMRRQPWVARAALRDLDSLNRRSRGWSRTDRLRFLLRYLGQPRLDAAGRRLWAGLVTRARKKGGGGN